VNAVVLDAGALIALERNERSVGTDICDAHVALIASMQADALYTSDPADLRRLIQACGRARPSLIRC
jgi:hypothetical protein